MQCTSDEKNNHLICRDINSIFVMGFSVNIVQESSCYDI